MALYGCELYENYIGCSINVKRDNYGTHDLILLG